MQVTKVKARNSSASETGRSALSAAVVATMVAGVAQAPLGAVASSIPFRELFDDLLLAFSLLCVLPRLGDMRGSKFTLMAAWMAGVVVATVNAVLPTSDALVIARQVAVPVILVLIGSRLRKAEWDYIVTWVIRITLATVAYMLIELAGVRIFDPASLSTFNGGEQFLVDGLPGYYYYYSDLPGYPSIERIGGPFLNPPIAGVNLAIAGTLLWWRRSRYRFGTALFLLVCLLTLLTFSRAGWMILALGVLFPIIVQRIGKLGASVVVGPVAFFFANQFAAHGNSAAHSEGLGVAFSSAIASPLGGGFGTFGNYVKAMQEGGEGESLAGIAFAGFGMVALVLFALLIFVLWFSVRRGGSWEASLGLGVVLASLLSESVGALSGTAAGWICVGVAISVAPNARRDELRVLKQNESEARS